MEQFDFRSEKLRQAIEFLAQHPNRYTVRDLAKMYSISVDAISGGIRRAKSKYNLQVIREQVGRKRYFPKVKLEPRRTPPNTENVLVIGDLHEPFTKDGYREFCQSVAKQYKITHAIFIGDIVDNHAVSYHESDPDGYSAGDELDLAIENIGKWYKLFPTADVIIGNHDRLIMRKAFTGGIPRRWIMDFKDVLGTPGWNFIEEAFYDDVHYIHGEGGTARLRCKKDLVSTVQGHLHPQAYTEWFVGHNYRIFAQQVGCGVDRKSYALAYAKNHPKPALGVGVILNHGEQAFNVLMKL